MELRPYQFEGVESVLTAWENGYDNVCMVFPTGAGKTVTAGWLIRQANKRTMAIAHRQELVLQISECFASLGIYHRIIAPDVVAGFCAERHIKKHGQSYVDMQAKVSVAGVQTLLRRATKYASLLRGIELWWTDESHHCQPDNQWGKAIALFPDAIGLGVTATPMRCDKKPLDTIFDSLVVGPSMRDLINSGHLSEYKIFCPPQSVRRAELAISKSTGEFIQHSLKDKMHGSQIVGDVVASYLRLARGLRGLTFAVDIESARAIADEYNRNGVPAQLVTGDTPDKERAMYLDQLETGELLQLVNVDLFGEGMDCPALGVVSMARPTMSYGLYVQQFGRVLRLMQGKTHGIVIDHVGNVIEHGLPDAPREWSLAGAVRNVASDADAIPLRACANCMQPYRSHLTQCPYCHHVPVPEGRSTPDEVQGDLEELTPEILAAMRGEIIPLNSAPVIPYGAGERIIGRRTRDHGELLEAQVRLRQNIAALAGRWLHVDGQSDRETNKRFYLSFQTTIPEAMALRRADAEKLSERIEKCLTNQ